MAPCCACTSGASSESSIWPTVLQLALPLEHAGELGQVGLQPVLLAVALGGLAQVRIIVLMLSLSCATSPRVST